MRGPAHRRRARPRLSATGRAHFALDESDRSGVTDLLQTVQSATLNGTVVTGTLDVAQFKSESGPLRYLRSQLSGPSAFTAQLDPQGRLTKLAVDLPAPGTWTLDITGYGATTPPARPPTFDEEPDSVYQVLGTIAAPLTSREWTVTGLLGCRCAEWIDVHHCGR